MNIINLKTLKKGNETRVLTISSSVKEVVFITVIIVILFKFLEFTDST